MNSLRNCIHLYGNTLVTWLFQQKTQMDRYWIVQYSRLFHLPSNKTWVGKIPESPWPVFFYIGWFNHHCSSTGLSVYHHPKPIGSRYGIFTYIWLRYMVNVGKYIPYMDHMGKGSVLSSSSLFSYTNLMGVVVLVIASYPTRPQHPPGVGTMVGSLRQDGVCCPLQFQQSFQVLVVVGCIKNHQCIPLTYQVYIAF